ncbi:MAG: hypothetical protein ACREVM_08245, partial [Burkholderiales bacterium]
NCPAADEVVDFLQDRRLIEWLVHLFLPFSEYFESLTAKARRRKGNAKKNLTGQKSDRRRRGH